ncbi:MAG: MCE family protein [Calditrichae bacterium]|nr:MCE family protein [Calditrichia bacterium]
MDSLKTTEFKVGLTVLVSTFILIFGIIWGKGFKLEPDKIEIEVEFENIGGMVPGDPVTVNGVKEGKVLDVAAKGRKVITKLEISDHVQLYEDATFIVVSAELLAGMRVEIYPGDSNVKINMATQPFQGRYGGRIVDVGLTIDRLAKDMSGLTFRLDTTVAMVNGLLRKGDLQKSITGTLNNLDNVSGELRTFLKANSHTLSKAITDLETGAGKFNAIIDSNETNVKGTLSNINKISARLDTVSTSLKDVMLKIEDRDGTLGKIVNDSTLYISLNKTLARIDSLAKQIKDDGLDIDLF